MSLFATVGSTGMTVTGKGVFAGIGGVVATDASGDTSTHGADLTQASITQVTQNEIRFELKIADLPAVLGGTPEILNYNWPVAVGTFEVALHAWRSTLVGDVACGLVFQACPAQEPGAGTPRFSLNTCEYNQSTNRNECISVAVPGDFTASGVVWNVPRSTFGAAAGATLTPAAAIASSVGFHPLIWFTNGLGGDTMSWDSSFTVAPATVRVGIAPADTADADVPLTAAPTVKSSSGNFTTTLPRPAPGSYKVVAKACLGGPETCGLVSRTVEVP